MTNDAAYNRSKLGRDIPLESNNGAGPPALEGIGLTKNFGGIRAVDGADFAVRSGEFVAVVGDNGAGKSTLFKLLAGALTPDEGEIRLGGASVEFSNPKSAQQAGVETVWQDLALVKEMDVPTNIFLGREETYFTKGPLRIVCPVRKKAMRERSVAMLADMGIDITGLAESAVGRLSGGQEQAIAITRAASWASGVVLLDEPTAALGVRQTGKVLELCARLRDRGCGVAMVTHSIPSVLGVVDRIIVMRQGKAVADLNGRATDMETIVSHMVGGGGA